ncbi:hypothetical protein PUNSTDRAFT_128927 [Punctularia strigosozonata HHB-11173 SS5]|uniref:uncharacterized protein n=1 Tax=Punctularia strigosozonata (strain HHB-11173) TaxID=741275 RepID=UPI0004416685|nr:uncharacterized protein PUNSTDRAFT_128927 [Punctularia strigosozonata HHB-11173 SS5]EIN13240.1 hypothetical protein PUNSTDRAFT_128927 [Punctularia strigosozonata HHB-11173 SS5]
MAPPSNGVVPAGNDGTSTPVPAALAHQTASRPRNPARRRGANDDAPYVGQLSAGAKRQALERAEGEPRQKRKRVVDAALPLASSSGSRRGPAHDVDPEEVTALVDFADMPTESLYRYLVHYDIVPRVYPSPLAPEDPLPPICLLHPDLAAAAIRAHSPPPPAAPAVTAANRPRRDPKEHARRRTAARADEEAAALLLLARAPVLADRHETHVALASLAQRHFRGAHVKEVDTLAAFMCTVKAKLRTGTRP